jgi:hypothetical protein
MKLPQLSLRDLFWLVLVCGLAVSPWIERGRPKREADMWEKHAKYWRGCAEALARNILTVDPTWSTIFDGIPPTPQVAHEPAKVFHADAPPNITEAELMEMELDSGGLAHSRKPK